MDKRSGHPCAAPIAKRFARRDWPALWGTRSPERLWQVTFGVKFVCAGCRPRLPWALLDSPPGQGPRMPRGQHERGWAGGWGKGQKGQPKVIESVDGPHHAVAADRSPSFSLFHQSHQNKHQPGFRGIQSLLQSLVQTFFHFTLIRSLCALLSSYLIITLHT